MLARLALAQRDYLDLDVEACRKWQNTLANAARVHAGACVFNDSMH